MFQKLNLKYFLYIFIFTVSNISLGQTKKSIMLRNNNPNIIANEITDTMTSKVDSITQNKFIYSTTNSTYSPQNNHNIKSMKLKLNTASRPVSDSLSTVQDTTSNKDNLEFIPPVRYNNMKVARLKKNE